MEMYLPIRQCRDFAAVDLVVRSSLPPGELAAGVRAALKPIAPNLPGQDFRTLQQLVDKSVSPRRFIVVLLGGFAVFALLLASLGIYGVVSYGVTQRTQEIGIRMALGAQPGQVRGMVLRESIWLAATGVVAGVAASFALTRLVKSMLYGIQPYDPPTMAGGVLILLTVALAASWIPARRAARVQPMEALRHE